VTPESGVLAREIAAHSPHSPHSPRSPHPPHGPARPRTVSERWHHLRDRVLSNPEFQRWAARFPLTRGIARRRASGLFDLCAGFVYSQVLQAVAQLGLLEALAEEPETAPELALRFSLRLEAMQTLLDAATSLRLVERRGQGRYGLGAHGASFIGNPAVGAMVAHHALLYRDLSDPLALLRGERTATELGRFWSYVGDSSSALTESDVAGYSGLMASSLALIAADLLEAYPHERHRRLLDIGGGEGAFLEAVAGHAPHLELVLFDLPPVARRARTRLNGAGLSRVTIVGGDLFHDPLPADADLISLVRVVHDHDDAQALRLLQAVRRSLRRGGSLLVAEPMAETEGAEPMGHAYFGFYLLAMGQGRPRTAEQLRALLLEAGFDRVRPHKTRRPMLARLLVADVV
jgi:demethylspheroidene O-methyltransferase